MASSTGRFQMYFFVPCLLRDSENEEYKTGAYRYHRDIKNIPSNAREDRCNVATKRELERIVNDINHPNQIFLNQAKYQPRL